MNRSNRISLSTYLLATILAAILIHSPAWAVVTPYDDKPAAVCCENNGLLWDQELAAVLNPGVGRRITVLDSCHSGGFVNDLASRPLSYVAAACDWDEYSYGEFGQRFMTESKTHTLSDSFYTAANVVLDKQLPKQGGDLGAAELNYLAGDRAVLFSASDPKLPEFQQDIITARDSLTGRPSLPWPAAAIASYFGNGAGYTGAATRQNLLSAVDSAVKALPETGNLFLYMNDHGTSTDVIKSRVDGRDYEYQTMTSLWRGWTNDNPYGIWCVRHELIDQIAGHYQNIHFEHDDWTYEFRDGYLEYKSERPNDPNTWLLPGVEYDFGYTYYTDPVSDHVAWQSWATDTDPNSSSTLNDWGAPDPNDSSNLGIGAVVWLEDKMCAVDPSVWEGWTNGGDGWVLSPIPEPVTISLLALGSLALLRRRN